MTLRVIQWATGGVGRAAIEGIVAHPELELVGCWVHSASKAGRDAGELCGLGPLGVTATSDVDALVAQGIDVVGPTYHGIFRSIYFFDPNGHRLELACNIGTPEQYAELKRVAPLMLQEWSETKKAPRHADWLHVEPDA